MEIKQWPEIMTIPDVAGYLQIAEITVRRMIERKELPAAKIGKQWRLRKQDIDDYLAQQISGKNGE